MLLLDSRVTSSGAYQGSVPSDEKAGNNPQKFRLSREVLLVLAVVIISFAAAGVFFWWLRIDVSTDDAQIDTYLAPLSSRVAGYIQQIYVVDNQQVKAGQLLVELDPRDYQAAANRARAALHQAESQLAAERPNVAITTTSTQTAVENAQAAVNNAAADLAAVKRNYASAVSDTAQSEATSGRANRDEARYRTLLDKKDVSVELYDEKESLAKSLRAQVEARKQTAEAVAHQVIAQKAVLDQAKQRLQLEIINAPRTVSSYRSQVRSRIAAVEQSRAELETALLNLSYCRIVAPVNGVVGRHSVQVGAQVAAGWQLLIVTPIDDIWVTANFRETQMARIHPGQKARVHVDALPNEFEGYVESMPGATGSLYTLLPPENATGNYVKVVQRLPVRIRFYPNQPNFDRLRPGMSVEPRIFTGLISPDRAVNARKASNSQ